MAEAACFRGCRSFSNSVTGRIRGRLGTTSWFRQARIREYKKRQITRDATRQELTGIAWNVRTFSSRPLEQASH